MKREKIIIPQILHDQMVEHGRMALPYEACGMLSGNRQEVMSIWPLQNEWKSDRRFFVSKQVVEQTIQKANDLGEQILAIYHTHPSTEPKPSHYDIKNHLDKNIKMVIVSYKANTPTVKWYRIMNDYYQECYVSIKSS
ncbi:M67 family metallopeptidase [Gracilibacillus alcaliphilus]|uniref:Mov34/MPN/PAD-1 family protein n=1 Tax=Gracilibacillus alcaliphilus TaxID=1401441 RepID=UPI0019593211|nr:M67 family metallopeptidase [Gracilibacillus alcaliphilus]MBM7675806.1 proteasome lid subunit RPN8/RPN11 [Gracilibacillus alcaliphilus]